MHKNKSHKQLIFTSHQNSRAGDQQKVRGIQW